MTSVFYSWQAQRPNRTNRSFIEKVLQQAVADLRSDGDLEVQPRIDKDTAGIPGAPDIAQAILEKIDSCTVFVADVSFVGEMIGGRPTPNPNVLVELGYAMKSVGLERIVLIQNTAWGSPDQLPFDLKMLRTLTYELGAEGKAESARGEFRPKLTTALRSILESVPQFAVHRPAKIDDFWPYACQLASDCDQKEWRGHIQDEEDSSRQRLFEWRTSAESERGRFGSRQDVHDEMDRVVQIYAPLLALSLAGVESGRQETSSHKDVFDLATRPQDWAQSGLNVAICAPEVLGYVFHAVHGAFCLRAGIPHVAWDLADHKVIDRRDGTYRAVWRRHEFIGWSELLTGSAGGTDKSWGYLFEAGSRWSWLPGVFGNETEYRTSLLAYFMAMNVRELAESLRTNLEPEADVPVGFLGAPVEMQQEAVARLARDRAVETAWTSLGIDRDAIEANWHGWVEASVRRLSSNHAHFLMRQGVPFAKLLEALP